MVPSKIGLTRKRGFAMPSVGSCWELLSFWAGSPFDNVVLGVIVSSWLRVPVMGRGHAGR